VPSGLLQRLLTRSGILPFLRGQWREDQASATAKLERRFDKQLAALKEQVDRMSALAERMQRIEPLVEAADRITTVDRDVRMLRATLALNIARRQNGGDDAAALDPDHVDAQVRRAVASARTETDPSVHVVINDLTPEDTYRALIDGIPPRIFFSQRDDAKQNLKLSQLDVAPERTLETLAFIEQQLIPQMMVPALLKKFEPHIRDFYLREYGSERGPRLAAIPHEATGGRLMLRRPGYHLDPHLDPKRVVFTCLIYFARPGDSEAYGTSFYRINGTPKIDRTSTFYPESQGLKCDVVKMVPFKANSAVAFLNYGGAHGADIPRTAPKDTERYAYQFYVSPEPRALAAIVGETEAAVAE
jgi:hypothetical protein